MGLFSLPSGWVYIDVNGKWENVMNTDSITTTERAWLKKTYPNVTRAKFVMGNKETIFEL